MKFLIEVNPEDTADVGKAIDLLSRWLPTPSQARAVEETPLGPQELVVSPEEPSAVTPSATERKKRQPKEKPAAETSDSVVAAEVASVDYLPASDDIGAEPVEKASELTWDDVNPRLRALMSAKGANAVMALIKKATGKPDGGSVRSDPACWAALLEALKAEGV